MLGISWTELLLVMAVAVLVIGPQDLPRVMYGFGRIVRRIQYVKYAFSQQFEDFLKQNDLDDLRRSVNFEAPAYDEAAADDAFAFESARTAAPLPETTAEKTLETGLGKTLGTPPEKSAVKKDEPHGEA